MRGVWKLQWGRVRTGSQKNQVEDEIEFGEEPQPTKEVIVKEHRDIFIDDPVTKTIDFRNLKVTDIKDCP